MMDWLYSKYSKNILSVSIGKYTSSLLLFCFVSLAFNNVPVYGVQLDFSHVGTERLDNGDANGLGATMTYESVAIDNGVTLDLIVTTLDSYSAD